MTDTRKRWRRLAVRTLVVVLVLGVLGAGGVAAYVASVEFPALRTEPQASVLYYRDGKTILARVGTTDHSDVSLSAVPEAVREAVLASGSPPTGSRWRRGSFSPRWSRTPGGSTRRTTPGRRAAASTGS